MSFVRERVGVFVPLLGVMVAAGVLAFVPSAASAQLYEVTQEPFTYAPMPFNPGGPVVNTNIQGMGYPGPPGTGKGEEALIYPGTLPFPVRFYGETYDQINILGMGVVTFGDTYTQISRELSNPANPTHTGQHPIPTDSGPYHNFVAVWWDLVICNNGTGGALNTQTVGTAPDRSLVIQWTNCRRWVDGGSINAQLWLHESSSDIEVRYGTASGTWSAMMGIENADGTDGTRGLSASGTACSPCTVSNFPTNTRIIYSSPPQVAIDSVTVAPQPINIGYPVTIDAIATNVGGQPATDSDMRFWIGPSSLMSQAREIGVVSGVTVPGGGSASFLTTVDTTGWEPGTYYVIAEFDPFGSITPLTEPRTTFASTPIIVKVPTAALRVLGGTVSAPGWVESGGTFDVTWGMDNRELLEAVGARFSVVLSKDSTVDDGDSVIGSGYFSLASNGQVSVTKTVTIPDSIEDGTYYVGVSLDPDQAIPHVDRSGNKRMSVTPTSVGLELAIVTAELPGGRVGESYTANLVATGGDNTYAWSVVAGSLPAGVSIASAGGVNRLTGMPSQAGVSTFTLQAVSGQFTERATYTVEILPALVPLEVVTGGSLPNATVGSGYSVALEARGGNPPYTWAVSGGTIPAGLTLSETGRIGGTPTEQGISVISVSLSDAASTITGIFSLEIGMDPLECEDVKNHAPVMIGAGPIHPITLIARGGKAPYAWATVSGAVPGLEVSPAGVVSGTPMTAGSYDWTIEVTDDVASKKSCHVKLDVFEVAMPVELRIATTTLSRAQVAQSYEAALEATDFTGTVTWSMGVDGVLPEGLLLTPAGKIQGVPSVSALGTEKTRTFTFEVVATDSAQNVARATLALELYDDRPPAPPIETVKTEKEGGGCQSTSGDAGLLGLGLALGMAALVRRRR